MRDGSTCGAAVQVQPGGGGQQRVGDRQAQHAAHGASHALNQRLLQRGASHGVKASSNCHKRRTRNWRRGPQHRDVIATAPSGAVLDKCYSSGHHLVVRLVRLLATVLSSSPALCLNHPPP